MRHHRQIMRVEQRLLGWGQLALRRLRHPRPLTWGALAGAVTLTVTVVSLAHFSYNAAGASSGAGLLTFRDTGKGTTFTIQTSANDPNAGVFTFETPAGTQYHGGQARDLQQNGDGTLGVHFNGSVTVLVQQGQGVTSSTATVRVNATVDTQHLKATAELSDTTNAQHFVMVAQVPGNARSVAETYNQAAVKQDWATLYTMTSSMIVGDFTQAQFAQMMSQAVASGGTVTAIAITGDPQVGTNPAGMVYCTVPEQVTVSQNGVSQTVSMTTVFVLEGGAWKFWFSK